MAGVHCARVEFLIDGKPQLHVFRTTTSEYLAPGGRSKDGPGRFHDSFLVEAVSWDLQQTAHSHYSP